MKYTYTGPYLEGTIVIQTDNIQDVRDLYEYHVNTKSEESEKDPNQMELPFKEEPKPEAVEEVKKVRKPRAKKEEPAQVVVEETNIAGEEIAEEPKEEASPLLQAISNAFEIKEEPKAYTTADLQKAIIDFVTKTPDGRDARTTQVKELVLKYSKSTAAADFPVKKIGDFLKDLEALA